MTRRMIISMLLVCCVSGFAAAQPMPLYPPIPLYPIITPMYPMVNPPIPVKKGLPPVFVWKATAIMLKATFLMAPLGQCYTVKFSGGNFGCSRSLAVCQRLARHIGGGTCVLVPVW